MLITRRRRGEVHRSCLGVPRSRSEEFQTSAVVVRPQVGDRVVQAYLPEVGPDRSTTPTARNPGFKEGRH